MNYEKNRTHELNNLLQPFYEQFAKIDVTNIDREALQKLKNTNTLICEYNETYKKVSDSEHNVSNLREERKLVKAYKEIYIGILQSGHNWQANIAINPFFTQNQRYIKVPRFLLNNIVMNSLKHGLHNTLKTTINIAIKLEEQGDDYLLIIEDDGIGVNKSKELKKNQSSNNYKGLNMIEDSIQLYNQEINHQYEILFDKESDIKDRSVENNEITGTIVQIKFKQRYSDDY